MHLVVVGNGMVGHKYVETLIERGAHRHFRITVCGEERHLAYDRVHLSDYFAGKSAADLSLTTHDYYREHGIEVLSAEPAVAIHRDRRCLTTGGGRTVAFDRLVLATGSYPFVPPIEGRDRPRCLVYRTLDDLDAIRAAAAESGRGTVVGGGLLGLECANALKNLGLDTQVVEFAPRLMAVQLDGDGGAMLRRRIEDLGVEVLVSKQTTAITAGEKGYHRMHFADGSHHDTDLIVFSAGIRPRDELARACGLTTGPRGGVVIDGRCRTSDPHIYAIGECAAFADRCYGLVSPGYQMAQVAVDAVLEGDGPAFAGADMSTQLKLLGVEVASLGDAHAATPGARCYRFSDERAEVYKKLVVSADGKQLLGGILVGDSSAYATLSSLMLAGLELPANPEQLILPSQGEAPVMGPDALPTEAVVCTCNGVTKGSICAAVDDGAVSLGAIKSCTKASTTCGGCGPLVKQILDKELARRGIEVNNHLCEHFAHSRQELYHLVRVEGITSFKELLNRYGRGAGCDICKPAVASILASCWNQHVLDAERAPLQDTNDRFLANMQKNGTYSVVPRVPGGELTPDKLIAIGQVAKEFGLYTKITGGQRIDLFGAQLHQLPTIWRALVDAGLESGHAYAKALRTVKSCVGSTWCRYGVQDSVGLAIALENRYKGLRAPHKLKLAVSGCTRECAEAQSKDVGVIATEKGWNLYVCGNGGVKPRHADLLATDLDTETLVRTIDRFLMFYVKTADRLQRTAPWLEGLEGGLDYLRQVVCDDSLGLGAELERQMAQVIDSYQCEWRATLEDPEKLKRFRHFVNSDDPDPEVVFVDERGQIRPATVEEKVVRFVAKPQEAV
ncbi:MAG: nitrite reductase large subunit NirB [Candidatus Competibacterales bacterium]